MSNAEFYDQLDDYKNGLILKGSQQEVFLYNTLTQILDEMKNSKLVITPTQEGYTKNKFRVFEAGIDNDGAGSTNKKLCVMLILMQLSNCIILRGSIKISDSLDEEDMVLVEGMKLSNGNVALSAFYG